GRSGSATVGRPSAGEALGLQALAFEHLVETIDESQIPHTERRLLPHDLERLGLRQGPAVRAVGGQGVVDVCDRQAAKGQSDLVALEAVRVSPSVEPLV